MAPAKMTMAMALVAVDGSIYDRRSSGCAGSSG